MSPLIRSAKELGYAQAMAEVAQLIAEHSFKCDLDRNTLITLISEIDQIRKSHIKKTGKAA
ncbi:hypothetical protein UFOVP1672_59 [uncultured Caudovirales phage]|uniref:Uncharacterized protein n=1 Tax=uncultured Caudovirales phage TaxID=2100421 RepID=A0A6J5PY87_9CAUD|nr:hypothetical protein UFOVP988_81 [uncultured Caudovirales phage]CAB4211096.1 hypothetical protein UFOVP1425_81 [uncultured Caudovirales phage]CAB4223456.1 hypothetical protein UFOVP1672_59 [uncultured Caudovirales phage]